MKNKNLILSIIFYILSIILLGVLIIGNVNSNLEISNIHNILFLIMLCLFTYIASFNLSKYINNFQLIFFSNHSIINNYFKNHVNLIPFHTVLGYIKDYNDNLNTIYLISNVYGNLILCMPFALFFPLLFKKQNKFINYFITIVLIVLGIELLQLITLSGCCDIDDVLLNTLGACIMFKILNLVFYS